MAFGEGIPERSEAFEPCRAACARPPKVQEVLGFIHRRGLVRTALSEESYRTPGVAERREAVVPLRQIGTPEDIAHVVVSLSSRRAGYVTGQEIVVDGGFSQTLMSHVPRPGYE